MENLNPSQECATTNNESETGRSLESRLIGVCASHSGRPSELLEHLPEQFDYNNVFNSAGDALVHVAARAGNLDALEFLVGKGATVNISNQDGETPLMLAIKEGNEKVALHLVEQKVDLNIRSKRSDETPLHFGVRFSNGKLVESMILAGADVNAQDGKGCTGLHLACQQKNIPIALMLIHLGAKTEIVNQQQETALHEACRNDLFPVLELICSKECSINTPNKIGSTPLHVTAKTGNIDTVRMLLLSGADIDIFNKDGMRAEDIAMVQGHSEVSDLLSKLGNSIATDRVNLLREQLKYQDSSINSIKVKIFGNQGVGKSTLIESLKCGFLWSLVRKFYSGGGSDKKLSELNEGLKPQVPPPHESYTRGVDVHQVHISEIGDISLWEFSGFEAYFAYYDFLVGDPSCIHVVVFDVSDERDVVRKQIFFWLNFIRVRIAPAEPIGSGGRKLWAPHVMFVATHASDDVCPRDSGGAYGMHGWKELLLEIKTTFDPDLIIDPVLHVINAQQPDSIEMKGLKIEILKLKEFLTNYLGKSLRLLHPLVEEVKRWTKMLSCPVVEWSNFLGYVRGKLNGLVMEGHARELVNQMQIVGEMIYLISPRPDREDLILLSPKWLTSGILGRILSYETIRSSPVDGHFTADRLSALFPNVDLSDLTNLLICLDLCVEVAGADIGTTYYFPALDFTPPPSDVWDGRLTKPDEHWHGVRIGSIRRDDTETNQMTIVYPRTVVALRNGFCEKDSCPAKIKQVRQWKTGMRADAEDCCILIQLSEARQCFEVIVRGCKGRERSIFDLSEYCIYVVMTKVQQACPGIHLQRCAISPCDLSMSASDSVPTCHLRVYDSQEILEAQLKRQAPGFTDRDLVVKKTIDGSDATSKSVGVDSERLIDLLALGSEEIFSSLILGKDAHISCLSIHGRFALAQLLDDIASSPCAVEDEYGLITLGDFAGEEWKDLAESLQVSDAISKEELNVSRTDAILATWSYKEDATIARLAETFEKLGRQDAREHLLRFAPMFLCLKSKEFDKSL